MEIQLAQAGSWLKYGIANSTHTAGRINTGLLTLVNQALFKVLLTKVIASTLLAGQRTETIRLDSQVVSSATGTQINSGNSHTMEDLSEISGTLLLSIMGKIVPSISQGGRLLLLTVQGCIYGKMNMACKTQTTHLSGIARPGK